MIQKSVKITEKICKKVQISVKDTDSVQICTDTVHTDTKYKL